MSDEVASALVSNFGFKTISLEDCGLGQGQTRRFRVAADGKRYVAKYLAQGTTAPTFECDFLQFLSKKGVPVARNLPTIHGEPFATVDGRALVLYEWAEGGVSWPAPPGLAAALGKAIARMHRVSDSMPQSDNAPVYDLDRLLNRPLRLLEPFSPDKAVFQRLVELTDLMSLQIELVSADEPSFGPIHGDIHQGNCHFTEAGELTLIDFALCGVGYRAYDLTGFLWPMRDRTIEDPAMAECCQSFLAGYEAVRPLLPTERAAIQAFVHVRTLWESGDWLDTGTGSQDPEGAAKMAPYMVTQFETWCRSVGFRHEKGTAN